LTNGTPPERHLLALAHAAADAFTEELHARLADAGHPDVRPGHGCVIGNIDRDHGSRLTDVAACAGYTKQAVGEAATDLERLGYLERLPDPVDGRAKVLCLTDEGRKMRDTGFAIVADIEKRLARRHGRAAVDGMRALLEDMAAGFGGREERAAA
jgi:DNA-binding MarR family transcriptional regulator